MRQIQRLRRAAALEEAVRRDRRARAGFLIGQIEKLWSELSVEWHCSPGWAERQVRRHLVACVEWEAAVLDGLISA